MKLSLSAEKDTGLWREKTRANSPALRIKTSMQTTSLDSRSGKVGPFVPNYCLSFGGATLVPAFTREDSRFWLGSWVLFPLRRTGDYRWSGQFMMATKFNTGIARNIAAKKK